MQRLIQRLEIVLLTLVICHMPLAAEPSVTMPEELSAYAVSKGCEEVRDFFTRPGVVNPPYVYGYLEGQREGSAVLWCQRREGEGRRFRLLVLARGKTESRCPLMLEWRSYPGGLSIFNDRRTTLDGFVYVADPKRRPPPNVRLTENAILSEYDGIQNLFYCYRGEWVIRRID